MENLERVDYTVGGDDGKGRFRMITKLILRYSDGKPPLYRLFQIASVDYAKDDIAVLRNTVLSPIGASLKKMMSGGSRFMLFKNDDGTFSLKFGCRDQNACYCDVPTRMFCVGDLKFYAQMLGRDNMSGSWCMWCRMAPSEWKSGAVPTDGNLEHLHRVRYIAYKRTEIRKKSNVRTEGLSSAYAKFLSSA